MAVVFLKKWVDRDGTSEVSLALDLTSESIRRYLSGDRRPSDALKVLLEKRSRGLIRVEMWFPSDYTKALPPELWPKKMKVRAKNERDKVRRPCVAAYDELNALGQLNKYETIIFDGRPDYGKASPQHKKSMKLDGYRKGLFDIHLICLNPGGICDVYLVECKYGRNGYTTEQQFTADACEGTGAKAFIVKNVDEFITFMEENLMIKGK